MELPVYEGGSGGKFPRRPFRRPAATPYDRHPSAARGMRRVEPTSSSGRGWLWKLVDPASRFIAGSTSRIFSSMFRYKRLLAPTEVRGSEQNSPVELYVPDAIDAPTELTPIQEVDHSQSKDFGTPGMTEIEQLLKQNKYTRAQVDYLTGLIFSRTFEPSVQESKSNNEKVNHDERNEERSTGLNRMLSTPQAAQSIPLDVAASPAEIAKAYMSSRLPKISSSTLSSQNQVFQKNKSSPSSGVLTPKQDDLPSVPRSVLHIPEVRNLSGVGYPTLKPRGRSSMSRMSRSPYFNANPTLNAKVNECTPASNDGPASSSHWPSGRTSISHSRQVLKRGNSFLDREDGSFGPIRRIRQKSTLISSPGNPQFMPSSSYHASSLLYLDKEDVKDPASSEKPSSLSELKYSNPGLQNAVHGDGKIFTSNFPPVPRKSSETCRKILEQLDKFAPSREERPNIRSVSMDESPSMLTTEMLNGPARRSMDNVDTGNFTSLDVIATSAYRNIDDLQEVEGSQSDKAGKTLENGPSRLDSPRLKFATAANGIGKQAVFNKASSPSLITPTGTTNTVPARVLSQRRPAFQMSAPEDLLELDDEQDAAVSAQSTLSMVKADSKTAETDAPIFAMSAPENPLFSPSKNINFSSAVPSSKSSKKASDVSQISAKESNFRFPASTESNGLSTSAFTPTISFQSHEKPCFQNKQTLPTFMFGSQNSGTNTPSPDTSAPNESPIKSKAEVTWLGTNIQSEGLNTFNDGKSEACLHKSPEIVTSSGSTDGIAFASIISSQSNGSLGSSSVSPVVSASTPEAIPTTQISLFSSNSKLTGASSGSPPISTTLSVLSSAATFSFGAAASTSAPVSVSLLPDKSISVYSDGKVAKDSPFRSSNPTTTHAAFAFSSTGSSNTSLMGSATFPVLGSTPSATISTSIPSNFSQVSSSGSGFAAPTSFSSGTNGMFGSTTSAQTSSMVFSAANSSFPNSSTNFGTTGKSLFGVQPAQFGSGTSLFSQSLTSQPGSGSFSSAALGSNSSSLSTPSTFGLSSSSSSPGFGLVPFATTNQTAKSFGSSSGFSFTSGVSNSSSSGFSFGTANASGVSSFGFGSSSSGSVFSFTSAGASSSAATSMPIFGMQSTSGGFSSVSPNNDQMNVEDTMADDTNQAPGPIFPTFGQPNSGPASSNFVFGSAVPSGGTSVFQFVSQQNSSTLQNPNPFQAGGGIDFNPGGSFSLGSGGGDKSARKIVKVRRDKIRRK